MNLSFQPMQLIVLVALLFLIIGTWKSKNIYIRVFFIAVFLIAFLVNPFRMKQEGGASLETTVDRFSEVPEKVIVTETPFEEHQQQKMRNLKQDSLRMKDDIHD